MNASIIDKDERFTTGEVCRGLDFKTERFRVWQVKGYVQPTEESEGQGKPAYWSILDAAICKLFANLLEIGFSRKNAGEFIKAFRRAANPQDAKYILIYKRGKKVETFTLPEMKDMEWVVTLEKLKFTFFRKGVDKIQPKFDFTGVAQNWGKDWGILLVLNFEQIIKEVGIKLG